MMPQCPTCGAAVEDASEVCAECGTNWMVEVSEPPRAPSPPQAPAPASPPPEAAPRLILKRAGALTEQIFDLGERVVLGRFDPHSGPVDVDLGGLPEAGYISRRHAMIFRDATGAWYLRDLVSANGTFIRPATGDRFLRIAADHPLNDGDEIALGNVRFLVCFGPRE
ncbi:MAG: FHA domain-containing protein [Armatimonadetes bacterium]|nr:FHA domain-containing protein [Armatimonadota bacterium]